MTSRRSRETIFKEVTSSTYLKKQSTIAALQTRILYSSNSSLYLKKKLDYSSFGKLHYSHETPQQTVSDYHARVGRLSGGVTVTKISRTVTTMTTTTTACAKTHMIKSHGTIDERLYNCTEC